MKKMIIIYLLILSAGIEVLAQGTPAFIVDTNKSTIVSKVAWYAPFDIGYNVVQPIYYKGDFPTMPPQGFITDIFIRIAYATPSGSTLPGLTIKMGITSINDYPQTMNAQQFLSIDSTLTTVYYDSFYVLPASIPANGWWKLTLPQPFQYSMLPLPGDVPQNLIVQMSKSIYSSSPYTYKFHTVGMNYAGNGKRHVGAIKNNPPGTINTQGIGNSAFVIGFNGYALSIDDPQKKVPFSVFPNPATDKLHLSKEASGSYEVYDLRGAKVLYGSLKEGEEVNVQHLSPGMYLLRVGERTTRFVKR